MAVRISGEENATLCWRKTILPGHWEIHDQTAGVVNVSPTDVMRYGVFELCLFKKCVSELGENVAAPFQRGLARDSVLRRHVCQPCQQVQAHISQGPYYSVWNLDLLLWNTSSFLCKSVCMFKTPAVSLSIGCSSHFSLLLSFHPSHSSISVPNEQYPKDFPSLPCRPDGTNEHRNQQTTKAHPRIHWPCPGCLLVSHKSGSSSSMLPYNDKHACIPSARTTPCSHPLLDSCNTKSLSPHHWEQQERLVPADRIDTAVCNHVARSGTDACGDIRTMFTQSPLSERQEPAASPTSPAPWQPRTRPTTSISLSAHLLLALLLLLTPMTSSGQRTSGGRTTVSLSAIIPRHFLMHASLKKELSNTFINTISRDARYSPLKKTFLAKHAVTFLQDDSPREILKFYCDMVLGNNVITVLNINNPLGMRRRSESNKYVLELAAYLGIPVISWDTQFAASSELGQSGRGLQLAPTLDHQAQAMVSLLNRYNWTSFSIVTSQVTGAADFVASLESLEARSKDNSLHTQGDNRKESLEILSVVHLSDLSKMQEDLRELKGTDTRVFLLHCSSKDAYDIMEAATAVGLTGKEYQWILTRTSIPGGVLAGRSFPVGMLGVSFEYGEKAMKLVVRRGMSIWLSALNEMAKRPTLSANKTVVPDFTCDSDQRPYWQDGDVIYRLMLNVSLPGEPDTRFNQNGTLQKTELNIINLQWKEPKRKRHWVKVGWWKRDGLTMQDITWPGESSVPPIGRPKRGFLRVATLNERPYVIYRPLEADGTCGEKALPCWIYDRQQDSKTPTSNVTQPRCCVGLSMDLLKIFSDELNFDFHIKEVEDGKWGALSKDGKRWNGLVEALLSGEADIVMTSIKINPERAEAIRFSVPYLETGIKIIVALRDGAISPTAFLEPFDIFSWVFIIVLSVHTMALIIFVFEWVVPKRKKKKEAPEPYDYASWALILIFSVHATGTAILIFEWLSPYGLNRGLTPMREHKFSLFRSFWLIWAMLFSTSVQTDQPKGIASRFLANIWALFALVFLASYTANLAAFMITKEEYYDLSGIQDYRLQRPRSMNPPFKYATIPNGSTEANIRANHKEMYRYMQEYNQPDVDVGIAALKAGEIQAFIYDASVLEYYASRDPKCRLVTVGNRYAMTGYGVGFGPDYQNPWIRKINKVILKLQNNGELDRLQKFWLAGACDMKKEKGVSNRTLGILNFTSAFILLGSGVLLGLIILVFEHSYFIFGRKHLSKIDKCGCCALVSLSMGKSLQLKECVDEAISKYTRNRCKDPVCETQIWKLRHQLDMALLKIENLSNLVSGSRRNQPRLTTSASGDSFDGSRTMMNDTRPNGTRRVLACGHAADINHAGWRADARDRERDRERGGGRGYAGSRASEAPRLKAIQAAPEPPPRSDSPPLPPPPPPQRQSSSLGRHLQETTFDAAPGAPVPQPPEVAFRGSGNMVDKFERFLESFDRDEDSFSPAPDEFDSFLPPPPFGESPLISKDNSKDSVSGDTGYGFRGSHEGGATYIGFEDLSSDGRDSNSGFGGNPGHSGNVTSSTASPMHTLRRTPSYTSAVGGSLGAELSDQTSPQPTPNRVRQYGGKKYVGVQNDTPPL